MLAHIFWIIAPIVQVSMPMESYSTSPFQTTQKESMERELLGQQSVNRYLMSSYYVQGSVQDTCPCSPSYTHPPQLLPVTSHHPSVLCSGFLCYQSITGPIWASVHCIVNPSKRRASELFPQGAE